MANKLNTKEDIKTTKVDKDNSSDNQEIEVLFTSLRADNWDEFHGQDTVKKTLRIAIQAARKRNEAMEHVLLYGPPGLGKTTLSHIIAKEMDKSIRVTSGPALERSGDLASILTNLENGDILFIDEIHRLNKVVEETLYPAMEDFALDIVIGKGPSARTVRLDLPQFTIVGATTRVGLISGPLRDRFGVVHRMNFYSVKDLCVIIKKASSKLSLNITDDSIEEIAVRSRGTPRIALKLLKRVRDYAEVHEVELVRPDTVVTALDMLEVDNRGLDSLDVKYLEAIIKKHDGGPVGIETIASTLAEDIGTIEEMTEPYLMQIGFIKKTPRGRVATREAYGHLKLNFPEKT